MDSSIRQNTLESEDFPAANELLKLFTPDVSIIKSVHQPKKTVIHESKFSGNVAWWVSDPDRRLVATVLSVSETCEDEFGFCPPITWNGKSTELASDLETNRLWTTGQMRADPTDYFRSKHGDEPVPTFSNQELKAGVDYRISRAPNFKELSHEEQQLHLAYLELLASSYPTLYSKQTTTVKFLKGDTLRHKAWYYNHDLLEEHTKANDDEMMCDEAPTSDRIVLVKYEK